MGSTMASTPLCYILWIFRYNASKNFQNLKFHSYWLWSRRVWSSSSDDCALTDFWEECFFNFNWFFQTRCVLLSFDSFLKPISSVLLSGQLSMSHDTNSYLCHDCVNIKVKLLWRYLQLTWLSLTLTANNIVHMSAIITVVFNFFSIQFIAAICSHINLQFTKEHKCLCSCIKINYNW